MYGAGFDAGWLGVLRQQQSRSLVGMGGFDTNGFFEPDLPAGQPAGTAAGSAAGEASGPAGESQGGPDSQVGVSQGATETVDPVRLAAARTLVPGCGLALAGWKPAAAKPRKAEMITVILERDSTQLPKHMDPKVPKCITQNDTKGSQLNALGA